MKSIENVGMRPTSLPLTADSIVEFHAARLLLLLHLCGISGRIDGLTKLAKLDFFSRYPDFFEAAKASVLKTSFSKYKDSYVESSMVRYHYGPWDKRYYHVLAYLESKNLIVITKEDRTYRISLSKLGQEKAKLLMVKHSFKDMVERMKDIKKIFGRYKGADLKNIIYDLFELEVGQRALSELISI